MGALWDRLTSWLRPEDKIPIEPWDGESVFDAELPEADASGIEVLNDDVTPMEYVVAVLMRSLGECVPRWRRNWPSTYRQKWRRPTIR